MDEGNITLQEFWILSEQQRGERYKDLSDSDKFRVRMSTEPSKREVPCNVCVYNHRDATCDAFPQGINGDHIRKLMDDATITCNGAFHFMKKEK